MLVKNKGLTHKNFILISSTMCSLLLYNLDACLLSIIFRVLKVYQLLTVRCKVNVKFERIFFFKFEAKHFLEANIEARPTFEARPKIFWSQLWNQNLGHANLEARPNKSGQARFYDLV